MAPSLADLRVLLTNTRATVDDAGVVNVDALVRTARRAPARAPEDVDPPARDGIPQPPYGPARVTIVPQPPELERRDLEVYRGQDYATLRAHVEPLPATGGSVRVVGHDLPGNMLAVYWLDADYIRVRLGEHGNGAVWLPLKEGECLQLGDWRTNKWVIEWPTAPTLSPFAQGIILVGDDAQVCKALKDLQGWNTDAQTFGVNVTTGLTPLWTANPRYLSVFATNIGADLIYAGPASGAHVPVAAPASERGTVFYPGQEKVIDRAVRGAHSAIVATTTSRLVGEFEMRTPPADIRA